MDAIPCPTCDGTLWSVYVAQTETSGSQLEVFLECPADSTRLRLGEVEGDEIAEVSV